MKATPLDISGAWVIEGRRFTDERGWFQEWFKGSALEEATGYDFVPVQTNVSLSAAGVIRGIHYSVSPAGQGKLVTVMSGEIDDYVVDVRPSSPTYGQWRRVRLSSSLGNSVLLSPHLGHAFQALREETVVTYLVTTEFNPAMEKGVSPFCRDVGIIWDSTLGHSVSQKDENAPGLGAQRAAGLLPRV